MILCTAEHHDFINKDGNRTQYYKARADLGRCDRFFLLTNLLHRKDADRDWIFDRCRETQLNPDGFLDLWAREHYKSTIITYAGNIQNILNNQDTTICILSHTQPVAKSFLRQIKFEFEDNQDLKRCYPEILWSNPKREAPMWSVDDGIIVKRTTNSKEPTVLASGLVDGMKVGFHFQEMNYDDVVTRESVFTPEQIEKTTSAWRLSSALGTDGGVKRYIGTRYHMADTYHEMIEDGAVKVRLYPATDNGKEYGEPVLLTKQRLSSLRLEMGPYIFAAQMLQNPTADRAKGFKEEWLRFWEPSGWKQMNTYITVDPAHSKKKDSDYTAMIVFGFSDDGNYYVIDMVRDRLSLPERIKTLFELHRIYQPKQIGYERYGMQSDVEAIKMAQNDLNYRFDITELAGRTGKNDRIEALMPLFEQGKVYLPETCLRYDYEKKAVDLTKAFIKNEYMAYPVSVHDDILDAMARIRDPAMLIRASSGMSLASKSSRKFGESWEKSLREELEGPISWMAA